MKILLLIKTLNNKHISLPSITVVIDNTVVLVCFPPETPRKTFLPEMFLNEATSFNLLRDSLWFFLLEKGSRTGGFGPVRNWSYRYIL